MRPRMIYTAFALMGGLVFGFIVNSLVKFIGLVC